MAQHGYLREYDEDFGGDDRERGDWRARDERDWRSRDRGRGFMFGDEDRDRFRDRDDDRGFFSRMGDEARSWFRDDERDYRGGSDRGAWENNRDWPQRGRAFGEYRRDYGYGSSQGDYRGGPEQRGFGGSEESRERQSFSSHPDDHYRSWRDRQMQALDRDYADYCREREQQFHSDFDSWRQNRQQNRGQQGGGQDQDELLLGASRSETGGMAAGAKNGPQATTSPEGAATLGTNNPENSGPGRGGRR